MQSASRDDRIGFDGGELWERLKGSLGGGRVWSSILVLLLTLTISRSTATFHWVDGIEAVTPVALFAALLMGALAVSPIMEPIALLIGALLSLPVAVVGAWPQIHAQHADAVLGPSLLTMWSTEINSGRLISDLSFFLVLILVLMWVTGGWLSWCVLRWRKPMLGLIPGSAAFATNLLNIAPGDSGQNGYTLEMVVLTIALLLWTNYTGSVASAVRARVKLTGDARWDFWESGLVAMLGVVILSIFLPPMSTVDKTVDLESGVFASWAQLQLDLSHPGFIGLGQGAGGVTGFSADVKLDNSLQRTHDIVFTYTTVGSGGARYFRGINDTQTLAGEWRSPSAAVDQRKIIPRNQQVAYVENYDALSVAEYIVKMRNLPAGYGSVIFYPGELFKIDRTVSATQVSASASPSLLAIDRLDTVQPNVSTGGYTVYSTYSAATVAQLQAAGTEYPAWVMPYAGLPSAGYRQPEVLAKIRQLALDVTAGTDNPYDAASRIEAYLRDPLNFTYTLTPPQAPPGTDKIGYFLFSSKKGYCEFFATAMGDMLRSIGIPTRLVNGFGPGVFDPTIGSYVVRSSDAHTWVEVYFPRYGWIPFEPTADNVYQTIPRGPVGGGTVCFRDEGCDTPSSDSIPVVGSTAPTPRVKPVNQAGSGANGGGLNLGLVVGSSLVTKVAAVLVALVLLLLIMAVRYLRPRTVMAAWNRTLMLAGLAGAERRPGETPRELGLRLKRSFPEAAAPLDALTGSFAVAAYAPEEVAAAARPSVMEAWVALRPLLLRRVFARLRPNYL